MELAPRDGIQNEAQFIPTEKKIELIHALNKTGVKRMEAVSFVSPKHVPQMADAREVMLSMQKEPEVRYMALIPNEKGHALALESGVAHFALVVAASETFNQKNVRMPRKESIDRLRSVVEQAKQNNQFVRFHISTAFWCPYEGKVNPQETLAIMRKLEAMDVDEIVVCDTIGRANPREVGELFDRILDGGTKTNIAAHFHDTYGFAQANAFAALQAGVTTFDASAGGLGGCPFAPGAAGNIATEDLVFMLHEMGVETGIDFEALLSAVRLVKTLTDRTLTGHVHKLSWRPTGLPPDLPPVMLPGLP